ncbi:MAG TPA: TldD/PmbA family protein, partial [Candidatus Sulfopaludibacter sp.]|nr:TldD/PmbA family protein [Candidatus Sulfopaludibacter sp.]
MRSDEVFGRMTDAARARGVGEIEAIIATENQALTRFANNAIHQNVAEQARHLSVRVAINGRTARASTNRVDRDSIGAVVEQAIAITRSSEPDPELLPMAGPAAFESAPRFFEATARTTPQERALAVSEAIRAVEDGGQTAAGIYATGESSLAIFNSRGVAAEHRESLARFSITAMAGDSSGWAKASACYHGDIDPVALAFTARQKAEASGSPREIPPGKYTVILEPAAVLDLAGQMFADFSATAIRDGRSFLNDRLGKQIFGENITIHDNALHALQAGAPFDAEGVPRRRLTLVDRGVPREIAHCRQAAAIAGVEPTGHGYPLPNEYGE